MPLTLGRLSTSNARATERPAELSSRTMRLQPDNGVVKHRGTFAGGLCATEEYNSLLPNDGTGSSGESQ